MKRFMIYVLILLLISLTSCTWNPIIVKEGKFLPSETLSKHQVEVGIQNYLYIPSYFSISYGFTNDFETAASFHYLNGTFNMNLNLYYQLIKKDIFLLSGNVSESFYLEKQHNFFAADTTIGIIPGIKPCDIFTIYTPINFGYLYSGSWGNAVGLSVGIGLNFNFNKLRVALEGDISLPQEIGDIDILPYIGIGMFYKF